MTGFIISAGVGHKTTTTTWNTERTNNKKQRVKCRRFLNWSDKNTSTESSAGFFALTFSIFHLDKCSCLHNCAMINTAQHPFIHSLWKLNVIKKQLLNVVWWTVQKTSVHRQHTETQWKITVLNPKEIILHTVHTLLLLFEGFSNYAMVTTYSRPDHVQRQYYLWSTASMNKLQNYWPSLCTIQKFTHPSHRLENFIKKLWDMDTWMKQQNTSLPSPLLFYDQLGEKTKTVTVSDRNIQTKRKETVQVDKGFSDEQREPEQQNGKKVTENKRLVSCCFFVFPDKDPVRSELLC